MTTDRRELRIHFRTPSATMRRAWATLLVTAALAACVMAITAP